LPDSCEHCRVLGPGQPVEDGEDSSLCGHEDTWQALLLFQVIGLHKFSIFMRNLTFLKTTEKKGL